MLAAAQRSGILCLILFIKMANPHRDVGGDFCLSVRFPFSSSFRRSADQSRRAVSYTGVVGRRDCSIWRSESGDRWARGWERNLTRVGKTGQNQVTKFNIAHI